LNNSLNKIINEQQIKDWLWEIISILEELGEARTSIKKLRNHPIHDFTDFFKRYAIEGFYTIIELELLQKDIQDVADDFKNSRNLWVKDKTANALRLMQSLLAEMKNSGLKS
jgi:hypothetical protein